MKRKIIYSLACMALAYTAMAQTKLYEQATGENVEAYKHEDKLTAWAKLSDESGKYVYARTKTCQTIANKKTGGVAHPFATIEVKAPEGIGDETLTGFINIVGKKTLVADGTFATVADTTQQFFDVSATDPVFSVDNIVVEYSEIDNVYVTFFTNDSEEAKEKSLDKKMKPVEKRIQEKIKSQQTSPSLEKIKKKSSAPVIGNRG